MHQIREWLYIGGYRNSTNTLLLQQCNVGAMLLFAEPIQHPGIESLYLHVDDGESIEPKIIAQGLKFIREQKSAGRVVLSACGAGISRSTTFAIGALMEDETLSWQEAYLSILAHHPAAMPHASLMQSLLEYFGKDVPEFVTLWEIIARMQQS